MSEDLARLQVRIEANTARFDAGMNRTQAVFSRAASSVEARAAQMNTRVAGATRAFGGMGTAVQQAGFQVGDFAVQIASGQGVLLPFIQQGTQLVSMFGPWGAVIGAAGAVVGALATTLMQASDASDELADSADDAADAAGRVESAMGGLESVVDAYADAIANTAGAQVDATDTIVAQTKREFEAKKDLLELEIKRAGIQRDLSRKQLGTLQGQAEKLAGRGINQIEAEARRELGIDRLPSEMSPTPEQQQRLSEMVIDAEMDRAKARAELGDQIKELGAQTELLDITVARGNELLGKSFEDIGGERSAGRGGRGGRRGGGGRAARPERTVDAFSGLRDSIENLERERELMGLSESAAARLTAQYERQRVVKAALDKIRQEGREPTEAEIQQAETLGTTFEALAVANFDYAESLEQQADAAENAKQRQEDLARSITDVADRLLGAIQQADSFKDALKNVGLELLRIGVQGLGGQGPLGGLLGSVIPKLFGSAKGNVFSAGNVIPFARGGVVSGPTTFPMPGGMGLMGEAGPEAIMPLRRGPGGRLGVEAAGGTSEVVIYLAEGLEAQLLKKADGNAVRIARREASGAVGGLVNARKDDPGVLA